MFEIMLKVVASDGRALQVHAICIPADVTDDCSEYKYS